MGFRLAADLLVLLHLAFILFVVLGGFLAWRWRRIVWLHLPAAAWGATIELAGWICPLTPLEITMRRQAGGSGYTGGFIEHYLLPIIYPAQLTRDIQLVLAAAVVAVNVLAYYGYWRRRR